MSLPFTDYCPPLACAQGDLVNLYDELLRLREEKEIRRIEIRWGIASAGRFQSCERYILHTLSLAPGVENVCGKFSQKFRQYSRRGERLGLTVNSTAGPDDMATFYALHLKTRRKLGIPIQPMKYFKLLDENIISQGLGKVIIVSHEGRAVSGAVLMHFNGKSMIKYSACDPAYLNFRCQYYLFWKCIEWACSERFSAIDFGKTDISDQGLRHFKNGWGAAENRLPFAYLSDKVLPASGSTNRAFRELIRHSPPWVCRVAGELLYGHFA